MSKSLVEQREKLTKMQKPLNVIKLSAVTYVMPKLAQAPNNKGQFQARAQNSEWSRGNNEQSVLIQLVMCD